MKFITMAFNNRKGKERQMKLILLLCTVSIIHEVV